VSSRIADNLETTLAALAEHSRSVGRCAPPRLIAVTKSMSAAAALELYRAGQRDFGENRLSELEVKQAAFEAAGAHDARWHFLGHLQRNKARRVVRLCYAIHSVDSLALIETLERVAEQEQRTPAIFVELAMTGEAEKTGMPIELLAPALQALAAAPHLQTLGLMCMAPLHADPAAARAAAAATFAQLAHIASSVGGAPFGSTGGKPQLSMGMSADWPEAVAAGSDWVRIGSALAAGAEASASSSATGSRPAVDSMPPCPEGAL
jgi:PLP dependent protein